MKQLSLNGAWTLEIPGTAFGPIPAQVPGSVYHDLQSLPVRVRSVFDIR